jgi:hypothetical protein
METDNLIRSMVADLGVDRPHLVRTLALALAGAFVVSAILLQLTLGVRPDTMTALVSSPRFTFKFIVTLLLAATALALVLRLERPGAGTRLPALLLAVAPLMLLAAVAIELMLLPRADWAKVMIGMNSYVCLRSIPLLAAPLLIAALFALRLGAPTRPALAGAVAGLLAGGLGAALYAAHCTDDSPIFVVVWYTLAIALVTAAGALAGRLVLRW